MYSTNDIYFVQLFVKAFLFANNLKLFNSLDLLFVYQENTLSLEL